MASPFAFVTLVSSDSYLPGALTQVAALRDLHNDGDHLDAVYVCLVTPESVDVSSIKLLRKAFDLVVGVEILEDANERRGLQLLGRPDLNTVLTKLHVFRLTQFKKIVFLDADVLPLRPLDHLFQLPHDFSAAPDVGWPDIFNSGVMVLTPGEDKFNELNELSKTKGSWDGGDQGLLNEWRGNDWNRLSFTYNTTPTAAYTYAPAYERFGSQISALHFIGRNKPWNSLPYRAPFTTNSLSADPSQQAYDYDSLVDRWYAVYDKHYRSQSNQENSSFEFQNYTSAWDEPAAADTIDLAGLKQFAIEGIASSANASSNTSSGEGKYISMPLDGRIDLMRPRKQGEDTERDDGPATPRMRPVDFQWNPLPTPLPHEVPPSPQLMPVALPPGTPHRFEPVRSDFYASESEREGSSQEPQSHEVAPLFRPHAEGSASPLQLTHPRPPRSGAHTPRRSRASSISHTHPAASQAQQQPRGKHQDPPNRQVPSHVPWDASREPPPKNPPATNGFPPNTYFPNRWDQSSTSNSHSPANESSSALFVPLPPPEIPEPLIRQGHYRNVTGEDSNGHTPSPDRTKVKTVFPWEQKPRAQPRRIFPESENINPPGLFLSPGSTSQTSTAAPSTPEQPKANGRGHTSSPLFALPSNLTYANAWDTVPSIQKYATKLIRPPQAPQLAPAFDDERWRQPRRSWDERLEAGSRDGDDGGNADDEDESDEDDEDTKWDDSDAESVGPPSRTPSSLRIVNKGKREYRDQAIQATPDTQDQGVQVPDGTVVSRRIRRPSKRISIPSAGNFLVPPQKRDAAISAGLESSTSATSATTATVVPKRPRSVRAMSSASASSSPVFAPQVGSPMRSPVREFMVPSSPDGTEYPPRREPESAPRSGKPAPHLSHSPRTSPSVSRNASNDSSITSPAESSGAQTPVADGPANGSIRQSGRVWDPARGVEIFKRGSEEVLARFLRMGSWENESVR